ncbi:hypothetical protein Pelo_15429 [Pelomyxa schiedti]|nr:hypothetical protein Pelo_15429 [Pelomyxa schiedti]
MVPSETLLIGHSLENDLKALKIIHTRVIDTSVLFMKPGTKIKCKLGVLAFQYFGCNIQSGAHNSVDDATVAMKLVHWRLAHGEPEINSISFLGFLDSQEVPSAYIDSENPSTWYNRNAYRWVTRLRTKSDTKTTESTLRTLSDDHTKFILSYLHAHYLDEGSSESTRNRALSSYNDNVSSIVSHMPKNSLAIVLTTPPDIASITRMFYEKRHSIRNNVCWTSEQDTQLCKTVRQARDTFARLYYNP